MDKCYIYRRVSTEMQIDGYSLKAQEEKIEQQCKLWGLKIVGNYCDEGKSGKSIEERDEFIRMCRDIKMGKDDIKFVVVYKLSRLGRNNADILNFVEFLKKYDIFLKCTDEPIDTSDGAFSTLILSVMGALVETERINIIEQTMAGRQQKAREGKWNGGQAPYGYEIKGDTLVINKKEAEQVKEIYRLFTETQKGYIGISEYFKSAGIKKIVRGNSVKEYFTAATVKDILTNPVYMGKIAYGRTKTEKIKGTNQSKRVNNKDYPIYDGLHEAIISEKTFNKAQEKVADKAKVLEKKHDLNHEYILSPLLVCPRCGKKMYGNCNKKKKKSGDGYYYDYFYMCDYSKKRHNHECSFSRQVSANLLENAVGEVIYDVFNSKKSLENFQKKFNSKAIDVVIEGKYDKALEDLKSQKNKQKFFEEKIATIDYSSPIAEKQFEQFQKQLNDTFTKIDELEKAAAGLKKRLDQASKAKVSIEAIKKRVSNWDKVWKNGDDKLKKAMLFQMIEKIEIYENKDSNGKILKAITFKVPVYYKDEEIVGIQWDKTDHDETVVLLTKTTA